MLPLNSLHQTIVSTVGLHFDVSSLLQEDSDAFVMTIFSRQKQWSILSLMTYEVYIACEAKTDTYSLFIAKKRSSTCIMLSHNASKSWT